MCAKFRLSISSRCDDIIAEVKGGNFMPPPAAGGWRGGPAAAGLKESSNALCRRTVVLLAVEVCAGLSKNMLK